MTTTKRSSKPIPVQVHRHHLSRPVAGDADEAEQGVADSMSNFIRPSGVNAVDVLSQICREYIDAAVEAIHRQGREAKSEGQKSEIRRKRRAVEAFGQELHERCFDMTEALDNNYALTMRVRRANREKIALRDELLRIRGERQSVALEMDEVQRNVEGKFLVAKEQDELNNSIHDVELALHRGRTLAQQQGEDDDEHDDESDMAYLELRIQDVAQAASSRGQGPGLLQDVQAFNAFLERTAAVLEGQG
ncbi:MAG: hypothetical protein M1838_001408 [Thelocarpon superellum]|nr:MAG: hypothetical protein M1838_001408 [Thelocarpon superellum]